MKNGGLGASFRVAGEGLYRAWLEGANMRLFVAAAYAVFLLAAWSGVSPVEYALLVLTVSLVITTEMLNTAIEAITDLATSGRYEPLAKQAKDIAAGAVLWLSAASLVVGFLIFYPRFPALVLGLQSRLAQPDAVTLLFLLPLLLLVAGWLVAVAGRGYRTP